MPLRANNIAVRPLIDGGEDPSDALSDVLESIQLRGGGVTREDRESLRPGRRRERLLYLVEEEQLTLEFDDQSVVLRTGDLAFIGRGDAHRVRPSASARWVVGQASADDDVARRLLEVIPPVIVVRAEQEPSGWLAVSRRMLVRELERDLPGSRIMISRILDLLIVQSLRHWANGDDDVATRPSPLRGALDPLLAPALGALHAQLERPWTLADLAACSRMSRSAFAARFARVLGRTPVAYLQDVRLERAADLLVTTSDSVAAIGRAVGYESSAAFSRAFARSRGASPRVWRQRESLG